LHGSDHRGKQGIRGVFAAFDAAALTERHDAVTKRQRATGATAASFRLMIRKLATGQYRLYSQKRDPRTGKRKNLGTFGSKAAAEKHERAVQYFKRHG
jgi:hypothetical protein